jgi:hypothetical protein
MRYNRRSRGSSDIKLPKSLKRKNTRAKLSLSERKISGLIKADRIPNQAFYFIKIHRTKQSLPLQSFQLALRKEKWQ